MPKKPEEIVVDRKCYDSIVKDLVIKVESLIKDPERLESFRRQAAGDFQPGGAFSLETRNRQLEELFLS